MLNNITINGRLVHTPELKALATGTQCCKFSVAVDRDYKKNGEKSADFFDVVCFKSTAEFVAKFFGKGDLIIVNGSMQSRNWEDKNGNKRTSWELLADRAWFGASKNSEDKPQFNVAVKQVGVQFEEAEEADDLPF